MILESRIPTLEPPLNKCRVYDFFAIDPDEFGSAVEDAHVIFAVSKTGAHQIVYGADVMQAIADKVIPPQKNMRWLLFEIDFKSPQLAQLCAAVESARGFHDCPRNIL